MSGRQRRAVFAGLLAAAAAGLLQLVGSGAWLSVAVAMGLALLVVGLPLLSVRGLEQLLYWRRVAQWHRVEGKHYSFGGLSLAIEDEGRHLWLDAGDLQRVLRSQDRDDVIAARHAGRWRRAANGALQLRVDAVVAVLATAPSRMDPHTIRLRRYLEREVLFPAAQRRERGPR